MFDHWDCVIGVEPEVEVKKSFVLMAIMVVVVISVVMFRIL